MKEPWTVCRIILLMFLFLGSSCDSKRQMTVAAPYPSSPIIESVSWDSGGINQAAPGSDIWPLTWGRDGRLYTVWGDGGGFGGTDTDGRVSLGVARIEGAVDRWNGMNVFGGLHAETPAVFSGKSHGILSVDGTLYMIIQEQNNWLRGKIARSDDFGRTWTFGRGSFGDSDWDFNEPGGALSGACFLQFGRDYAGARDDYVYGYDVRVQLELQHDIVMFRVPKDQIMNRSAYEFYAGAEKNGNPIWTEDIAQMRPVFTDPNGVSWGIQAFYHPLLRRYFLTVPRNNTAAWGIFDAPEPWGPWTTVSYYDMWLDSTPKFSYSFNQKWMSDDGLTMWMVFSGIGKYDAFNLIKATFTIKDHSKGIAVPLNDQEQ
ncbi:MAG: hypothetical protein COX20_11335 [Desulfobacterales bacterium CG23_combo_of_CG06-09_8_20_14_all_52_9]|nr:MAG: hypothetical protein COX20_11335 [Desulfobacterales bacterium CG23_combo_of_CG06-09_8_20_14_all_52_9]